MILMLIQRNEENGTEKELSLKTDQHLSTFIGRRGGGGAGGPQDFCGLTIKFTCRLCNGLMVPLPH